MTGNAVTQHVAADRPQDVAGEVSDRFAHAFRTETLDGLRLSTQGRLVSLAVIAMILVYLIPTSRAYYYEALLALFAILGVVHYRLRRARFSWTWLSYVFIALDFALLTFTLFGPNPLAVDPEPPQMAFRNNPIVYYFLLIAAIAFIYSPQLMLCAGLSAALFWSVGVLWLLTQPSTRTKFDHPPEMTTAEHMAEHLNPHFVDTDLWLQGLVLLLLVSSVLAFAVRRSHRLVVRQAESARERANLARYFSPNVLD